MTREEFAQKFHAEITPCGSRVTCNPINPNSDEDFLVVIPTDTKVPELLDVLVADGFSLEGDNHYQILVGYSFISMRKDKINLIVTQNQEFAEKHKLATTLCKKLNLMHKPDRIALFQIILYGKVPD